MHPILGWAWIPGESTMMSMGGMLKYFILPERKQKINTETVRQKKCCRGCAELPSSLHHPVCPGHMVPPHPRAPSYPYTVGRIKEKTFNFLPLSGLVRSFALL